MKAVKYISAIVGIPIFIFYQWEYLRTGMKPNEFYFIGSSVLIAVLYFLIIAKDDPTFIRSLLILSSTFFLMVTYIYIRRWVMEGDGSTNYYTALCWSAILTFIYLISPFVWRFIKRLYYACFGRKQPLIERK